MQFIILLLEKFLQRSHCINTHKLYAEYNHTVVTWMSYRRKALNICESYQTAAGISVYYVVYLVKEFGFYLRPL